MAIGTGIAQGRQGGRVGVYGFSESNTGVYAQSDTDIGLFAAGGSRAGYFDGVVEITKSLIVGSVDLIARVANLQHQIDSLQKRIADLQTSVPTDHGVPVHSPVSRPTLTVKQRVPAGGGEGAFDVAGSGCGAVSVHLHVVNERNNSEKVIELGAPDASGNIFAGSTPVACAAGDPLRFSATDNSVDPNDVTGLLWTPPAELVVFWVSGSRTRRSSALTILWWTIAILGSAFKCRQLRPRTRRRSAYESMLTRFVPDGRSGDSADSSRPFTSRTHSRSPRSPPYASALCGSLPSCGPSGS